MDRKSASDGRLPAEEARNPNGDGGQHGFASDPICLARLSDIFHLLLTEIDEPDRQLRPDVVPNSTRDANAS
jgi:hypothetical protein